PSFPTRPSSDLATPHPTATHRAHVGAARNTRSAAGLEGYGFQVRTLRPEPGSPPCRSDVSRDSLNPCDTSAFAMLRHSRLTSLLRTPGFHRKQTPERHRKQTHRPHRSGYNNRVPSGTTLSGTHSATFPSASWKPVTRHSDISGPICLRGKFTTATTSRPTSSSGV